MTTFGVVIPLACTLYIDKMKVVAPKPIRPSGEGFASLLVSPRSGRSGRGNVPSVKDWESGLSGIDRVTSWGNESPHHTPRSLVSTLTMCRSAIHIGFQLPRSVAVCAVGIGVVGHCTLYWLLLLRMRLIGGRHCLYVLIYVLEQG